SSDEKLLRIEEYIEENFRYEMERVTIINNWQPFAAPVTLERRYGDCKDRAVLFSTLAQKAGIHADVALLLTRNAGRAANPDLPSVYFNHAVVYVPPQSGVSHPGFMDSTTEDLDVDVMRSDDPGVRAFVFDPKGHDFHWETIPFQAPDANTQQTRSTLELTQ